MRARSKILSSVTIFLFTFSALSLAQRAPGNTGTTPARPTVPPPAGIPTAPTQQPQMMIYNGKVHVSGPPLQDAAKVVARCYGGRTSAAIYSAYTDLKGNYSLTFGQGPSNAPMDASVDPIDPMMTASRGMQVMQCEVTASAAGYIGSQITIQFRNSLDNTEMGKLTLQPMNGNAQKDMGGVVSAVSLAAPQNAQREYAKGIEELRDNKLDKAEKHFRKATEQYPKYAVAWERLGKLQSDANNRLEARSSFLHAIDSDPKYVPPYIGLASLNAEESQWDSVLELTNKAISIDNQNFALAYFLNGAANFNKGDNAAAEKSGLRAEQIDKQHVHPRIQLLLAEVFNRAGRPAVAAEHLRKFLELDPTSKEAEAARTKLAKLELAASK
jgi:tetratricopeptide (TPR) repeat protein